MDQHRRQGDTSSGEAGHPNRDQAERERDMDRTSGRGQSSTGITNRSMEEELSEQAELPERGSSRDESWPKSER